MSISIGIVGLPNVGKSTLFNALTDSDILAANYPFATIEPNTGIVPVPDPRLEVLGKLYNAQKIVPAQVTFVDIAGLVAGASQGEGLGNQFLANIRSCNAVAHVVRAFTDRDIQHVDADHSPKKDIEVINTELCLADLATVEKRLFRMEKEVRANPKLKLVQDTLLRIQNVLNSGTPLHLLSDIDYDHVADLQLITMKPVLYVFNVDEGQLSDSPAQQELQKLVSPARSVFVCAKMEAELRSLDMSDRQELLESYGQSESGLVQVARVAYETLGLQSYLTAGEKEVRAWTIPVGATAPQAAGVIHTDFEKGFIAAQIVNYDDLVSAGSEAQAKASGKIRTEGKTYIMQGGDVVEFRFNT